MDEAGLGCAATRRRSAGPAGARGCLWAAALACCLLTPAAGRAQGVIAYPTRGQSPEQQNRDRYECHVWAVQQSGFDPTRQVAQAAPPPMPPPSAVTTSPLRGAARGAAIGAVGGAIGGDAGKGAAIGAGTGFLIGGIRRNEQIRQQQAYQQYYAQTQQSGSSSAQLSTYNRAMQACLQGRGYSVS
ncbi:MAG TPA: glycine zipper family protein [Stellaceae bacterium]|nr:glycine zipper family protein [Stellaceae bacterium]